jgi:geranylgeranyl reductase
MHVKTLIIGAGPGGLACAKILAEKGEDVLVLDKKTVLGSKVCAGGITWSGLISRVPEKLAEQSFCKQYVQTPLQRICIEEKKPIIATVNREKLGAMMATQAKDAGASIRTAALVRKIGTHSITLQDTSSRQTEKISFEYLVGADGSSSLVRRHLGLTSEKLGVGINYFIPGKADKMEWHLNNRLFANGYAWIFPHAETISIGAYAPRQSINAKRLKNSLLIWAKKQGYSLEQEQARAEFINFDFQGYRFGNTFLVGDAAGLASGLTGEGIYPAIISGEQVAQCILNPNHNSDVMDRLIKKHEKHSKAAQFTAKNGILNTILAELMTLSLRSGILKFDKLEMAESLAGRPAL